MKLVSVIVTTCDRDIIILKEALDSVIKQTYKNIEIIVINDASKECYSEKINELVNSYNCNIIYCVNEKRMGANYSRNRGADMSHGEILSFLDDDDYWDEKRIEKVVQSIDNGAEIVYSDMYIFSNKGKKYNKRICPNANDMIKEMLAFNFLGGFSNVSFRKDVFYDVGKLNENLPAYQDQDLFIRLLQKKNVAYVPEPLSYYRITSNSISLNGDKKLRGLTLFLNNYNYLFEQYPESKIIRLENELVYAEKQGWKKNSQEIINMLKKDIGKIRLLKIILKGKFKYYAVKYLKLQ